MKVSRRGAVTSVAALMIVGTSSVAYAKSAPLAPVPDANGIIHACYDTKDDDPHPYFLRKAACGKKETQIDWNVQGVKGDKGDKGDQGIQGVPGDQGDKGDTGDTGDTGAPGTAGTSAVYTAQFGSPAAISGNNLPVLSKAVPAGKYAVTATVQAENRDGDDDRNFVCFLSGDGTTLAQDSAWLPDSDGASTFTQTFTVTAPFDAGANGGTLAVTCSSLGGAIWVVDGSIMAVKVDSIN